ncbi:MAG: hypothetical protein M3140_09000 [Actinomycetota bacterium]|nr:hypothetical protein [Actinomycetota bacterium]
MTVPVTVCGNGVGLLGRASASCGGGSDEVGPVAPSDPADPTDPADPVGPISNHPRPTHPITVIAAGSRGRSPASGRGLTVSTVGNVVPVSRSGRSLAYTGANAVPLMLTAAALLLAGALFTGSGRRRSGSA